MGIATAALAGLLLGLALHAIGRRIAMQSVVGGMLMSFVAMGFAAFGFITPVEGALIQEGIDVVVILNALRALRASAAGATVWLPHRHPAGVTQRGQHPTILDQFGIDRLERVLHTGRLDAAVLVLER